jgi:putative hydrolase of the HAD superfamily
MAGVLLPDTRAVFFDAVGTLLFPNPAAPMVYAAVASRAGFDLSPTVARSRFLEAYKTQELIDRSTGWVTSEQRERERWQAIVAATLLGVPDPAACFRELYGHFSKPAAWRLNPDAAEVIVKLRDRGLLVGLGSNYDSRLWSVLEGFPELAPLRDRVVISATVGFRKPAAQFFKEVVRVSGCEPGQVLFVGDDIENDYNGASAAGLNAVLLDDRDGNAGQVKRIKRLAELTAPPTTMLP